jgi:hypothetical protein
VELDEFKFALNFLILFVSRQKEQKDMDELIDNLNDLQVEVDGDEVVKVFCE